MAFISLDDGNSLVIHDCYEQKKLVSDMGGQWDSVNKTWCVVFTMANLEALMDGFDCVGIDEAVEEAAKKQAEKEDRLNRLKEMSKADVPVRLKVPGMKGTPYNYQKLGVMYAFVNGVGVLNADEMGLGKTIQAIATALMLKYDGRAHNALIVTPASLKFNWPLEIEKFTDEKYVVIDGTADERVAQWLRDDVFFYVVNSELLLEDLFGGREYKPKKDETPEQRAKRKARIAKSKARERILSPVRRKMWDFMAVDECFPYQAPVMTNQGIIPIGDIVEKRLNVSVLSCDLSRNELSYKKIVRWMDKQLVDNLVEVTHEYGKFACTANHKIWTEERGYIEAGKITEYGTSHLWVLPEGVPSTEKGKINSKVLLSSVFEQMEAVPINDYCKDGSEKKDAGNPKDMQRVPEYVCSEDFKRAGKNILLQELQCELESETRDGLGLENGENEQGECKSFDWKEKPSPVVKNKEVESRPIIQKEGNGWSGGVEGNPPVISSKGRKATYNGTTKDVASSFGERVGIGACRIRQTENGGGDRVSSQLLSDRHCQSVAKDSSRSRWKNTQDKKMEGDRFQKKQGFNSSRVVSVKVLERADYGRYGIGDEEYTRVYNLEVADNHNYIANGVLVSNCHMLKNHSSKRSRNVKQMRAKFKMALTGTPMDGRLEELHSVMGFVAPGLLGSKMRFFQRHVETDFYGNVTGYKRLSEVTEKIQPFFIRRLKKDVLEDLPDKIYENRVVLLSKKEASIYESLASNGHKATEDAEAVVAIIRCKQFCNWPNMVDDDCTKSSKMDAFKEVLDEIVIQNGHKALVFSQYKETLDIIASQVSGMGLKYLRIDGDVDKRVRAAYQEKFNTDNTIDLMIGTEAMSAGLNFTSADYVLNYDDNWAPAIMAQREDRSHRIGQKNVVTVVNFICKNTIEERIRKVIYDKAKVSATVLGDDTDEMVLRRLGPKDMAKLL